MSVKKAPQEEEPSMEEILASIRQIMSDTPQDKGNLRVESSEEEDILELTEAYADTGPLPYSKQGRGEDLSLSPTAIYEAAQVFHTRTKLLQETHFLSGSLPPAGNVGGQTIENITRELLQPLLKEWLDAHLLFLVRWIVNEQVEKIVAQHLKIPSSDLSSQKEIQTPRQQANASQPQKKKKKSAV